MIRNDGARDAYRTYSIDIWLDIYFFRMGANFAPCNISVLPHMYIEVCSCGKGHPCPAVLLSPSLIQVAGEQTVVQCYHKTCSAESHVQCLARAFCAPGELLPIQGQCTSCGKELLWGELIRKLSTRKGI